MLWFLYIAGAINCIVYVVSARAYANANTQAFEDLTPGFLMLLTAVIALVLSIIGGARALTCKERSWRVWVASLICVLPVILLILHAANRALHNPPRYSFHSTLPITPPGANRHRTFDWSVLFDASGGRLIETNEAFMFLAPEFGYQNIEITGNADDPAWGTGGTYFFYFQSRNGKFFGRIEADIMAQYSHQAAIDMTYFVNTNGSRNLEPANRS
jgi:hypothetical protein